MKWLIHMWYFLGEMQPQGLNSGSMLPEMFDQGLYCTQLEGRGRSIAKRAKKARNGGVLIACRARLCQVCMCDAALECPSLRDLKLFQAFCFPKLCHVAQLCARLRLTTRRIVHAKHRGCVSRVEARHSPPSAPISRHPRLRVSICPSFYPRS